MNTNESNNPMNTGTGSGSNYGTGNAGTGFGSGSMSTGSSSNATSGGNLGNSNSGDSSIPGADSNPNHDYSATQKGAAVAGSVGATVGAGIDAVQNAASDAGRAVTGNDSSYGSSTSGGMMTGMFRDRDSAERAYQSLSSRGYSKDDVNVLMSDETRNTHFGSNTPDTELGDKAMEGAGVGSAIGGTAGAIIGAIAAIGTSVALPGLGLVIAGPIAAALAGAGAGGLTGGLVGALVGSGIPEEHAKEYESDIKNGGIVMGVNPRNDEDARYFEEEFRRSNGDKVRRY
jgi:hypothetical protein